MVDVVQNNLDRIVGVCKKMQVKSLYLFGSATRRDDYTKDSDLDFLFQFQKDKNGSTLSKYDYFDLMLTLQDITGRKVDLVAEERIQNKYFLESINRDKL